MQSFEIKRGHGKSLEDGGLKFMMEDEFGEVEIPENSIFSVLNKIINNGCCQNITVRFGIIPYLCY